MPASIYSLTEIDPTNIHIIISGVGGGGTLTFANIRLPGVLPQFSFQGRRQKVSVMRPSADSPGYRIVQSYGSHDNYMDISFELPIVMPSEVAALASMFNARPGAIALSLDGGTNTYTCVWKESGLQVSNYLNNQRVFSKVRIELMVLAKQ